MDKRLIKFYELTLILSDFFSEIKEETDDTITIKFIKGDTWDK